MKIAILTPLQENFLNDFFQSYPGGKFFLTGGTGLAVFYLYHRLSEDLDLFTLDQHIDFATVNAEVVKIAHKNVLRIEHQTQTPSFIQYIFTHKNDSLKIDLVKDVPIHFGRIKKVKNVWVDSLENIAAGKLLAAFGRADAKDFIDLYFLFKEKKARFQTVFQDAKKKDLGLSEFYLAHMLSRVQDITSFPKTMKPFEQKDLVRFFLSLSEDLFEAVKPKE